LRQARARVDAKVLVTLRADIQIVFQVLLPDDLPAVVALHPQPLRANLLLARSIQLAGLSSKPSHKRQSLVACR
jgi:hypothetical protein